MPGRKRYVRRASSLAKGKPIRPVAPVTRTFQRCFVSPLFGVTPFSSLWSTDLSHIKQVSERVRCVRASHVAVLYRSFDD